MTESTFYGLQKIESGTQGLPTNDYAFGSFNIDVIDRLLARINTSLFDSDAPISSPTAGLGAVASTSGGSIAAGRTLRYQFTYVDPFGNETAASPTTTVSTSTATGSPQAPTLSTASTGGGLSSGRYFYALSSYVDTDTNESTAFNRTFVVLPSGSTNVITLTLPSLPAGATGFNIYKKGPGQSVYYYLDTVDLSGPPVTTYEDDGSLPQNATRSPVTTSTANSTNSVTLTVPGGSVPLGYTWKVYRSYSTNWDSSLLAWVTSETFGVITPSYTDTGAAPTVGHPPERNYILGDVMPWLNEVVDDETFIDGEAATPTGYGEWQNGWGDTSATPNGNDHATYYMDRERVFLQFQMTGGAVGDVAFVLPYGYWPDFDVSIVCASLDSFGGLLDVALVTVDVEGSVTVVSGSGTTFAGQGSWRAAGGSATP